MGACRRVPIFYCKYVKIVVRDIAVLKVDDIDMLFDPPISRETPRPCTFCCHQLLRTFYFILLRSRHLYILVEFSHDLTLLSHRFFVAEAYWMRSWEVISLNVFNMSFVEVGLCLP